MSSRFTQQGIKRIKSGAVKGDGGVTERRLGKLGQNVAWGEFQVQACAAFAGALDGRLPVYLTRHIEGEVFGQRGRVANRAGAGTA